MKSLGSFGEALAEERLRGLGYIILDRNWRTREGEIDIIAKEGQVIVFVEVRTRRTRTFGLPEESITPRKQERLVKTALAYLEENALYEMDCRFDLMALECSREGEVLRMDHFKDVIDVDGGWIH
jgi:putative endonuclease